MNFDAALALRLALFGSLLITVVLAETWWPRRTAVRRSQRWPVHAALTLISTALVRLLLPAGAIGAALWAQQQGWGLFNYTALPPVVLLLITLLLLDLAIYAQHRAMHVVPLLWRLHRVHHADVMLDASTALRFHPIEIALSMLYKMAVVVVLGASPIAVLMFEILLSATALFNHANLALPLRLDRVLRWIIVTPDMHRIHHSWHRAETNSNYGFNLPWWDHLFASYTANPVDGQSQMTIGLQHWRSPPSQGLSALLKQPLESTPAD